MTKTIQLGNSNPIHYLSHNFGEESIQTEEQPKFDTTTTIHVSPNSTMKQALEEIQEIWKDHSHDTNPTFIEYNLEARSLAVVLSSIFNDIEIKEILE